MKQQDILKLSDADLSKKVGEFRDQMEKVIITHRVTPIQNPLSIRDQRKAIARLQTELTKRKA
jgi:large subunit ribosomal protein L29